MKKFDIIVIGSGGGSKIITPASKLGLKVAVIEEAALGGTCLNRGCIPSKMLIHPADVASTIQETKKFDIHLDPIFSVNFANLTARISATVDRDSAGIAAGYQKNPNITFYHARGKFVSNKVVRVAGEDITADKIFIATGARPSVPDIEGLKGTPFMTSTEALRSTTLPRKLIVVGGGYIAVELGYAYGALGSDVHFLVRTKLVRWEDGQVADEFYRVFSKKFPVYLGAVPTKVQHQNGMFTVTFKDSTGKVSQMMADGLLIAASVIPNTDDLGLENTDIKVNDKGFIQTNDRLQTAVPGVYALGDCIGRYLFRHSVNFEGEYLMRTVFTEKKDEPIFYGPVPHAIFTNPQIAGAGKTEEELKQDGIEYVAGVNHYKDSAMGMALLSDHGFVKLLIGKKDRKILGVHIIGPEASNMIHTVIALMYKDGVLDDLLKMIYIHPALPEIVRNAARKAKIALDGAL